MLAFLEKINHLDDVKVSILTAVLLLIVLNLFLGARLLLTGEGINFIQNEAYVITGIAGGVNTARAILNRKNGKNGNGNGTNPPTIPTPPTP